MMRLRPGACAYALLLSVAPLVALAPVGVAGADLLVSPVPVIPGDAEGLDEHAGASDIAIAEISGRIYAVVAWPDEGILIFDISHPGISVLAASITDDSSGFTGLGGVSDIEIVEVSGRTYAVVTTVEDGVQILQLGRSVIPDFSCPAPGESAAAVPPERRAHRDVDVLVYGHPDPITAEHVELLESRGYTVKTVDGPVAAELERASVVVGGALDVHDAGTREMLTEYVHGGGRLLLLVNTEYATCGSPESPCWFDFTGDAFGFRFDGDVQSGALVPAAGSGQHPIWNEPNMLREFSEWCCDGYVGEITDAGNVTVVAAVSGKSYKHGEYTFVSEVPAVVVNDNPAWNGGMVVGTGRDMAAGWPGPDMRMFDNIVWFMMSGVHDGMSPERWAYEETGETVLAVLRAKPGQPTALQEVDSLEFSCSGEAAVRSVAFDGLASGFGIFVALKIGAGPDATGHQDLVLVEEGLDRYTATLDEPLALDGGVFTLSGTIVGGDPVLVTVTYDAARDETCKVVPHAAGGR